MANLWQMHGQCITQLTTRQMHGKTMANAWQNHGKSMAQLNAWQMHGSVERMANAWLS